MAKSPILSTVAVSGKAGGTAGCPGAAVMKKKKCIEPEAPLLTKDSWFQNATPGLIRNLNAMVEYSGHSIKPNEGFALHAPAADEIVAKDG